MSKTPLAEVPVTLTVNGRTYSQLVDVRLSLADFLRECLGLTGTHLGCEHGVCGACTVRLNGASVRSCLMLAVQANGQQVVTVEGLAREAGLHPVQQAFHEKHGLQCGFCTPGFLMAVCELLEDNPRPSEQQIRQTLSGNLCRCTGYQQILEAVWRAAELMVKDGTGRDGAS